MHFRRLWNSMFDRHQAEITVMQFTGHSLPVHQFVTVPWDFNHHHHHITLVARISLTLSRHSSLSFIALGRSSGQHPVSSHSCWIYVRAGRPAFARPCVGIHKSTSLMSASPTPMKYATSAVHWMACLARSEVNIQQHDLYVNSLLVILFLN